MGLAGQDHSTHGPAMPETTAADVLQLKIATSAEMGWGSRLSVLLPEVDTNSRLKGNESSSSELSSTPELAPEAVVDDETRAYEEDFGASLAAARGDIDNASTRILRETYDTLDKHMGFIGRSVKREIARREARWKEISPLLEPLKVTPPDSDSRQAQVRRQKLAKAKMEDVDVRVGPNGRPEQVVSPRSSWFSIVYKIDPKTGAQVGEGTLFRPKTKR